MTEPVHVLPNRVDADADSVERDLFKLVLTVIELIRQLMERQALRRVDEGDLADETSRPPTVYTSHRSRFGPSAASNRRMLTNGHRPPISCIRPVSGLLHGLREWLGHRQASS